MANSAVVRSKAQSRLNAAADYIEVHGWTKGDYEKDGRVCIYGAIIAVCGGTCPPELESLVAEAIGAVEVNGEPIEGNLALFNDAQSTRKPIIAVLRKAAGLAALKGN